MREWAQKNPIRDTPRRELIHLCVIDDEGFSKDELNAMGINDIRVFEKFTDIKDYDKYNVILCDIKGVGQKLDPTLDGIALAREIKKVYPDKIVLQYSSQAVYEYDQHFYKNMNIDGFVEKSKSTKELVDELDNYCSVFWNPISAWKYIEKNLRLLKIDNISIAFFENIYVDSLEKKVNVIEKMKNNSTLESIVKLASSLTKLAISVINLFLVK